MGDVEDYAHGGSPNESAEEYPSGLPKLRSESAAQRAENEARVHQEAHEPTGDWIELADEQPKLTAAVQERLAARFREKFGPTLASLTEPRYPASWSFPEIEAERRHREKLAMQNATSAYDNGFRAGVTIGRSEGEAQAIDGQLVTTTTTPSTYDAAVEAMHAAVRLVIPLGGSFKDELTRDMAKRQALMVTSIADELVRWLSEHIEADPDPELDLG